MDMRQQQRHAQAIEQTKKQDTIAMLRQTIGILQQHGAIEILTKPNQQHIVQNMNVEKIQQSINTMSKTLIDWGIDPNVLSPTKQETKHRWDTAFDLVKQVQKAQAIGLEALTGAMNKAKAILSNQATPVLKDMAALSKVDLTQKALKTMSKRIETWTKRHTQQQAKAREVYLILSTLGQQQGDINNDTNTAI